MESPLVCKVLRKQARKPLSPALARSSAAITLITQGRSCCHHHPQRLRMLASASLTAEGNAWGQDCSRWRRGWGRADGSRRLCEGEAKGFTRAKLGSLAHRSLQMLLAQPQISDRPSHPHCEQDRCAPPDKHGSEAGIWFWYFLDLHLAKSSLPRNFSFHFLVEIQEQWNFNAWPFVLEVEKDKGVGNPWRHAGLATLFAGSLIQKAEKTYKISLMKHCILCVFCPNIKAEKV